TLGGSVAYGIKSLRLVEVYKAYMSDSPYIQNNYVDPRNVKMSFPKEKRNLIHIYLESIENSYLSKELGGHMEQNLMPELTELSKEGIIFSHNNTFGGPYQTIGSNWSVASMVNMEMGIPLKIPMDGNSYGKNGTFLPGAVNIGDVLAAQGYEQTVMFGADADFGGLSTYFTSHGNYNIIDYKAAIKKGLIPKKYRVWWGFEDEKLFEFAKNEITRLSQTGKPFHFNMETADTHFPDGYITDDAPKKYESQYANVIAHSSTKTVEFIRWIQKQDFYENTTIVITGDHWSMDKKFFENFDPEYRRSIFNLILNPAITTDKNHNRGYAPFDMFPTMLASMGVEIEGEKLGLGTNLFSGDSTLIERDGIENISNELNKRSNFYNKELLDKKKEHKFENTNVTYR
ncbi:MAG: LTA synthase family protein, partial [Oscillospiraceae bacterium]